MSDICLPNTFYRPLIPAIFQQRLHRFAATVSLNGAVETVHVPNSGRLKELLCPGNVVWLHDEGHPQRQTRYTLVAADVTGGRAFIDSRLPNRILARNWRELPPLSAYDQAWTEVAYGGSRFDMALRRKDKEETTLLEAKCVTLVEAEDAFFPDAPSERGRRHLSELAMAMAEGTPGVVVFFAQHPAAARIRPHRVTDPGFADAMKIAMTAGVIFHGYRVCVKDDWVTLDEIAVQGS